VGTASRTEGDLVVGALAAVNAFGEVVGDDGEILAGARPEDEATQTPIGGTNTTLVVVATNARLSRERAHLLSIAAHEGIDEAVRPAHTVWDGDTVFSLATGPIEADQRLVEALAVTTVADAIRRAVQRAS
jgi:L-aminopeptidase/D-esterase-like protein